MVAGTMARDIPQKLAELGRIRIGDREPNKSGSGNHPHKLAHFRLTSPNRSLLHYAAVLYGGEVQPWTGERAPQDETGRYTHYELYTTTNEIEVLIPTFSAISLGFEKWSGAGCLLRCTGEVITGCPLQEALIGTACQCPAEEEEREALAKLGKACWRILRLNVLLPDLPGVGCWRLDTKGKNATGELRGTLALLQRAGMAHDIIEATLCLEQRTTRIPGEGEGRGTLHYAVPVLVPRYTPRQILSGASQVLLTPAPAQAMLPPALAETIAQLYGDPAQQPAGEDGMQHIMDIERAILAQHGNIEQWWQWAERRFKTARADFTIAHYAEFLAKVQQAAQERATRSATGSGSSASLQPQDATQASTGTPTEDSQESEDLFTKEEAQEKRAEEFGNG